MYLGLFLIVLAVLCLVGGIFSGGIFTIVLVPLAVIAAVTAAVALLSARAAGMTETLTRTKPLRWGSASAAAGSPPSPGGEVPATPDEFVEARQKSQ